MGAVNRRHSRLRDKFDEMAKYLVTHANQEQGPLKMSLTSFAEHVSAIQDYRQALIDRIDAKVVQPLSAYKTSCKHTQTDLNKMMQSRGREMKTHKQLETIRNKAPSDTQQITRAETELQRATLEVERTSQTLEEKIDRFENQRVIDIKKILTDFVQIEMLFHAKAVERLTMCYQDLQNLDLEDHLAIFRNSLRPSQLQERLNVVQQQTGLDSQRQNQNVSDDVYATPQRRQPADSENGQGDQSYDEESEDDDYLDDEEGESEYETEEESESPPATRQSRTRPF